jgi:predicted DNA-binding transcriptional regulator AlpA
MTVHAVTLTDESERLLTMKQVCAITSWSRTSINRLIEQNAFPKPIKLGDQRIAFKESEVRAYIASRRPRPSAANQLGANRDLA